MRPRLLAFPSITLAVALGCSGALFDWENCDRNVTFQLLVRFRGAGDDSADAGTRIEIVPPRVDGGLTLWRTDAAAGTSGGEGGGYRIVADEKTEPRLRACETDRNQCPDLCLDYARRLINSNSFILSIKDCDLKREGEEWRLFISGVERHKYVCTFAPAWRPRGGAWSTTRV
jgi:hypothetical protein